jgi:hypothetical protein
MSVYTKIGGVDWSTDDWFKSRWDYPRIQKIRKKKGLVSSDKHYRGIINAINTRHKTLITENITNLLIDGWTFGIERSKKGKNRKNYLYFYRQKRIKGTKNKHERVYLEAKDEDDYRNRVLRNQARREVFNNSMGGWSSEGLTPAENRIMDIIVAEVVLPKKLRDPIISIYIKQLGLRIKSKKYGITAIRAMSIHKKKNILDSARKVFVKHFRKSTLDSDFVLKRTRKLGTPIPMLPILME